jgi:NADH-quinone oxidoreductase subunit K
MESNLIFYLATFLFSIGLTIIIIKKNAVFVLMGVELILNAANLNLIYFSRQNANLDGQVMAVFVIVLAAAEAAIALAILLNVFKHFKNTDLDQLENLKY